MTAEQAAARLERVCDLLAQPAADRLDEACRLLEELSRQISPASGSLLHTAECRTPVRRARLLLAGLADFHSGWLNRLGVRMGGYGADGRGGWPRCGRPIAEA
jgi:hypothetical protein